MAVLRGRAFLSQAETGYRFDLGPRTRVTPFTSLQGVVFDQDSFTETGASICLPATMARREMAEAYTAEARDYVSSSDRHMALRHRLR